MTTGGLTAATGVSAKTVQSVTPLRGPVSALTGTRDGAVRSPVSEGTTARLVSFRASVSMVGPASTSQESVSAHRDTPGLCESQHLVYSFLLYSLLSMKNACFSFPFGKSDS